MAKKSIAKETPCPNNVIILNKPFLGGWLNKQGNIGHEIIDFLKTDKGEYYVYNNPWGICPDDIWIEGNSDLKKKRKEKYLAKYLVLTSEERGQDFDILYVIELAEKLHRYHTTKNITDEFRQRQNSVRAIIDRREIKYNGKSLYDIYGEDDSLYVTFKGSCIYKADTPIEVTGMVYNFKRNKGYVYDDEYHNDYEKLNKIITDSIEKGALIKFDPKSLNSQEIGALKPNQTFINLIKQEDNELIFTNILHSILEQGELLKHFCQRYKEGKDFIEKDDYTVLREVKVVDGRMDVCAEGVNQRIIIENKINSGLNGLRPVDNTSQLTRYYKWGKANNTNIEPLCFVVAPNYRIAEIKREIAAKDPCMKEKYLIKTYADIAEFIDEEYKNGAIPKTYLYHSLIPQIIDAFKNLSYSKEDIYARMFLEATNY